jgi:HlyD family secretion protein
MRRRIKPILIALVVGAAAFVGIRFVVKRPAADGTLGSGVIEADEWQVASKIAGRLERVLVAEGDKVRAGQLIATLEHANVDAERERAEGAVRAAEFAVRDMARGSRPEQIRAARARLEQAQAARRGAEMQLRIAQEGYRKATELKQQVDAARARVRASDAAVASAKARLDEARRGPTEQEIETARAAVRLAEARVESARIAAENAEQVYARQIAIEAPMIAAATQESVARAEAELANRESDRTQTMAEADAATQRALDQARAAESVAGARLEGATRSVHDAAEQVALTRAQAKQVRDAAHSALQEATRALDTAQAQLDVLLAGTREERVRQAEAALATAQTEADAARIALRNATEMYEDRLLARQQRDGAQASLDSALALERAARAELDLIVAGHTAEAIESARGRLQEAKGALKAAEVTRGYCQILAPCAGTVTEVVAKEGEIVGAGAPIVVIADLEHIFLRAYLSFTRLGAIRRGQTLKVVTDALPGETFEGEVIRISEEAEFTPKDVQTPEQRVKQVYWIKISLGDGRGLLKPGMPADVLP